MLQADIIKTTDIYTDKEFLMLLMMFRFSQIPADQTFWIPRNTGDGAFVSMNPERKYSANAKLTYALPELLLHTVCFGMIMKTDIMIMVFR